jgi:hypothetical protein
MVAKKTEDKPLDDKAEMQRGAALEEVTRLTAENKRLKARVQELEDMLKRV